MLNQNMSEKINQRQKGYHRDNAILQAIESYRALDTDQVRVLFFDRIQYGQRKAQERLLKLHKRGRLNRCKTDEGKYCYFQGEKPGMLAHLLGLNWTRIWLTKQCKSWEKVHAFQYEQEYGVLRTDGFAAIRNIASGAYRFLFIEMDRGTNEFDKIKRYNKLYTNDGYCSRWWVKLTERFPPILIVTISPKRRDLIISRIKNENSAGLEFKVKLLEDIKEEVLK